MIDPAPFIAEKLQTQRTIADAQAQESAIRKNNLMLEGEQIKANAAAGRAAQYGQAAAGQGQGALSRATAQQTPGLAASEIAQRLGAAALSRGQATDYSPGSDILDQQTRSRLDAGQMHFGLQPGGAVLGSSTGSLFGAPTGSSPLAPTITQTGGASGALIKQYPDGYSEGTAKVPGQGDGKTDTQSAMLAPGEAVLNKAAAEHLGRHTIDLLNALGEMKMGLGAQPTQQDQGSKQAPGYAKGTAKVPPKESKPAGKAPAAKSVPKGTKAPAGKEAPGALSPKLLAALMQMGGGMGGGMPAPTAQPMPMPMPMSGGPA